MINKVPAINSSQFSNISKTVQLLHMKYLCRKYSCYSYHCYWWHLDNFGNESSVSLNLDFLFSGVIITKIFHMIKQLFFCYHAIFEIIHIIQHPTAVTAIISITKIGSLETPALHRKCIQSKNNSLVVKKVTRSKSLKAASDDRGSTTKSLRGSIARNNPEVGAVSQHDGDYGGEMRTVWLWRNIGHSHGQWG